MQPRDPRHARSPRRIVDVQRHRSSAHLTCRGQRGAGEDRAAGERQWTTEREEGARSLTSDTHRRRCEHPPAQAAALHTPLLYSVQYSAFRSTRSSCLLSDAHPAIQVWTLDITQCSSRPNTRWRSTENENGHRAVCTGCIRPHSHELVVPLQHFGCMSQSTCCGVQPSTATIQPGYNRSTTKVQPQRIAAARIARACLVLWLWVMAGEEAGARTADDVMGMVEGGGGGARRTGWVDVVQSRLRQRQCSAGCGT